MVNKAPRAKARGFSNEILERPNLICALKSAVFSPRKYKNYVSAKIYGFKELAPFAKKVYKVVCAIPIGEVRSYKWVARKIGKPYATRAVGQALKRNPWPLLIPCHRVICADGKLGGYSSGKKKKRALLDLEKQIRKDMI